jgi:hypothetical protein
MKKIMIITLGVGKDIQNGIAKSIVVNNPNMIIFLATKESLSLGMPEKVKEAIKSLYYQQEIPPVHNLAKIINNEGNVKEVYSITFDAIKTAISKGYKIDEIYLDFTCGTKAMSVGAALAAFLSGCKSMVYIGGYERDSNTGKVITGSEIVMTFTLANIPLQPSIKLEEIFVKGPDELLIGPDKL